MRHMLLLSLGLLSEFFFSLYLRQIDFVQAYPQASIETDMFMKLPQSIETRHGSNKDQVMFGTTIWLSTYTALVSSLH
jgi:hypothetical protein